MFENKKFDVEHALNTFATSFVVIPAEAIYEQEALKQFQELLKTCHIYMIGAMPNVEFIGAREEKESLVTSYKVAELERELRWEMPSKGVLKEQDNMWYVIDENGNRFFPSETTALQRLNNEQNAIAFDVLYIGQSYGKDGSRNALDRLLKHETLQKISLKGVPEKHKLYLLLLEIQTGNRMITAFNPWAKEKDHGAQRIKSGINKLFDTSEAERITLYEASFIRYFQPQYNVEFKESFPSTNMKSLRDCYDKDFSALISEICIDELPFKMFTKTVTAKQYHIAKHDLHDDEALKMFFS